MYGNTMKSDSLACQIFPYMLSKLNNTFNYKQCSFKMQKSKQGTARIHLFNELSIPNIFTMEASFSGTSLGVNQTHFNTNILTEIGKDLCRTILSYHFNYEKNKNVDLYSNNLSIANETSEKKTNPKYLNFNRDNIINDLTELENQAKNIKKEEEVKDKENNNIIEDAESEGSDSEPSMDNLDTDQLAKLLPTQAKKKSI